MEGSDGVNTEIKHGSKIIVVEGPHKGREGIVSMVRRVYDKETLTTRWTVWAEPLEGGDEDGKNRIKTRLTWVRES